MRWRALILTIAVLLLVSGCDRLRARQTALRTQTPLPAAETTPDEADLHLKLVEQMIDKQLYHAALAHLQALESKQKLSPNALYLRADALRRLGRTDEATAVYKQLLRTSSAGLAYHGLGLIAANSGSMLDAVKNFKTAVELRPVDARLRNDLGYALLLAGDPGEAHFQLVTAQELGGDETRTRMNLLLLLFIEGDVQAAERFAEQYQIDPEAVERMRARAVVLAPAPGVATPTPPVAATPKPVKPAKAARTSTTVATPAKPAPAKSTPAAPAPAKDKTVPDEPKALSRDAPPPPPAPEPLTEEPAAVLEPEPAPSEQPVHSTTTESNTEQGEPATPAAAPAESTSQGG